MSKRKSTACAGHAAVPAHPAELPPVVQAIVAIVLLAGSVWLVYGRAVDCPFIFDDKASVSDNPSIVRLWPLWGDSEHPGPLNPPSETTTSGRPLVNLSFALNYHFGRLDPVGYRLFNIAVHALSALLLLAIVSRTLGLQYFEGRFDRAKGLLALAAALLWAVHPLQTETVVYITQRTELLMGFFYLATLSGSLRYWAAASPVARVGWLILSTLTCLAGAACKEVMVTAPVVVLLFERTFVCGSFRRAIERSWPLYVGLFLSWGLLLWLNIGAPRSQSAGFHLGVPAFAWWFTQAKVLWLYLKLAVWPWPLSIHYGMPYLSTFAAVWPWLLLTTALAIATLILLWRRSAVGFVGACFFLILSPTFVVPIITEIAVERRMYLPLAPLVVLAVVAGYRLMRGFGRRREAAENRASYLRRFAAFAGAVLILALVFSLVSIRRLAAFDDAATLWQDTLALNPDDSEAHVNFAALLNDRAQWQQAVDHSQQALRLDPRNSRAHVNLGVALANTGQMQPAVEQFQEAIRWKPDNAEAHNNLGNAFLHLGHEQQAIDEYRAALRLKPGYTDACSNLGIALRRPVSCSWRSNASSARSDSSRTMPSCTSTTASSSRMRDIRKRRSPITARHCKWLRLPLSCISTWPTRCRRSGEPRMRSIATSERCSSVPITRCPGTNWQKPMPTCTIRPKLVLRAKRRWSWRAFKIAKNSRMRSKPG